jgi:hypothetical protein
VALSNEKRCYRGVGLNELFGGALMAPSDVITMKVYLTFNISAARLSAHVNTGMSAPIQRNQRRPPSRCQGFLKRRRLAMLRVGLRTMRLAIFR